MSSSVAGASGVKRGGLRLKGGIVIRAAPTQTAVQPPAATSAATTKRKQHPEAEIRTPQTTTPHPVKAEPGPSAASPASPPLSPTAADRLPSDAPLYVKRTRRADDVEEVNAQLQQLNKANEHKDRRQLIEEDRQRAAQQRTAAEERSVDGVRLVDVSRAYVRSGFGDEAKMPATRKLNEREKKKSDRYCK